MWAAALLFAVGCGSSQTAADKCTDLISDFCNRGVMCIGGSTQQECVQQVEQSIACGKAVSVGPSYNNCIEEINMDACDVLFPTDPNTGQQTATLPADCQGVIMQ
jgi:hypothetical protein